MKKINEKQILVERIIKSIQDVKGEDIKILDLSGIENSVSDYFIICSGNSNTQVNAIAGKIEKEIRNELKERPWHVEGVENGLWVLMDYVSVVVHIFQKQTRDYYQIEELWGDAKITIVPEEKEYNFINTI